MKVPGTSTADLHVVHAALRRGIEGPETHRGSGRRVLIANDISSMNHLRISIALLRVMGWGDLRIEGCGDRDECGDQKSFHDSVPFQQHEIIDSKGQLKFDRLRVARGSVRLTGRFRMKRKITVLERCHPGYLAGCGNFHSENLLWLIREICQNERRACRRIIHADLDHW